MYRTLFLAVCLAVACSGGQDRDNYQKASSKKTNAPSRSLNSGSQTNQPLPAAPVRRGYDPPRLYVNDRGVHFEIFELDDLPYDGKVVTYHYEEQKIVATEKVFERTPEH